MENAKKPDQIGLVIKHIALSKEFAASRGMKPRFPLALAVSFARVTGIDLVPTSPLFHQLALCGQRLFGWPSPDGRPTSAEYYLTPEHLRERWVLVARLAANAWNTGQPKALKADKDGASTAGDLVSRWLSVFAGPGAKAKVFSPILASIRRSRFRMRREWPRWPVFARLRPNFRLHEAVMR